MRAFMFWAVLATVLCEVQVVEAHPPYEGSPRRLKARDGDVEIVKSYVDGIFGTDPAKIVVRSQGTTHVETKYFRDASFVCGISRCIISVQDSPFAVIPEQMWLLEGTSLRSLGSLARVPGVLVHLIDHVVGYGVALVFLLVPVAAIRQGTRVGHRTSSAAGCFSALIAVAAFGILVLWLYVVIGLSELSLVWALLLGGALFLGDRRVRAWRANNALKLTKPA